jgi:hypothetical protein
MPVAYPQSRRFDQGQRGADYDAAMELAAAVTRRLDGALSAAIMEAPPVITTTGELAALLAQLDPGTPFTLQETIQAQGDWDAPGGDWVRSVIADHGVLPVPAVPPVLDDAGREYAVLLPALILGLRWRLAHLTPEPGMQTPVHACDRLRAAHSGAEALVAAAAAVDGIARMLTGEENAAAGLPDGGTSAGLVAQAAAELLAIADRLRDVAPLADEEENAD